MSHGRGYRTSGEAAATGDSTHADTIGGSQNKQSLAFGAYRRTDHPQIGSRCLDTHLCVKQHLPKNPKQELRSRSNKPEISDVLSRDVLKKLIFRVCHKTGLISFLGRSSSIYN